MLYIIFKILFSPIIWLLYPTRFIGKKNMPKKTGMILAANHQSNRDVFILASHVVSKKLRFMGKKESFKNPLLGGFLKTCGGYPINRGQTDISAIKTTLRLLKQGKTVVIFPEGTRVENTDMKEVKNGVAMFASKTECPIVPGFFVRKPKPFRCNKFLIGKPFYIHEIFDSTSLTKEELNKASEYISERILELPKLYEQEKLQKRINRKMKKVAIK